MCTSPKNESYRRDFDETKYMSLLTKHDELLKKDYEIGNRLKIASKRI